jgi:hypothetical protein
MGHAYKLSTAVAAVGILSSVLFFSLALSQRPAFHCPIVRMGFEMVFPPRATKEEENRLSIFSHNSSLFVSNYRQSDEYCDGVGRNPRIGIQCIFRRQPQSEEISSQDISYGWICSSRELSIVDHDTYPDRLTPLKYNFFYMWARTQIPMQFRQKIKKVIGILVRLRIHDAIDRGNFLIVEWSEITRQSLPLLIGHAPCLQTYDSFACSFGREGILSLSVNKRKGFYKSQYAKQNKSGYLKSIVDTRDNVQGIPAGGNHHDYLALAIAWVASIILTMRLTAWFLRKKKPRDNHCRLRCMLLAFGIVWMGLEKNIYAQSTATDGKCFGVPLFVNQRLRNHSYDFSVLRKNGATTCARPRSLIYQDFSEIGPLLPNIASYDAGRSKWHLTVKGETGKCHWVPSSLTESSITTGVGTFAPHPGALRPVALHFAKSNIGSTMHSLGVNADHLRLTIRFPSCGLIGVVRAGLAQCAKK